MGTYPPGHIDRYVEAALARGVTEIGFTEHLYRCVEAGPVLGRWWERDADPTLVGEMAAWVASERNLSLARYVDVVLDAKSRGLPVKLGLEVDFVPGTEAAVLDLLAGIPFDYLVGSVHWIGAWNFMRDSAAAEFARRGVRRAFEQYFALEASLAASGMVDVLAHADVIKRAGLRPDGGAADLYDAGRCGGRSQRDGGGGLERRPAPPRGRAVPGRCVPRALPSRGSPDHPGQRCTRGRGRGLGPRHGRAGGARCRLHDATCGSTHAGRSRPPFPRPRTTLAVQLLQGTPDPFGSEREVAHDHADGVRDRRRDSRRG